MKDWIEYAKDWVVSTAISALYMARSTAAGVIDTVFEYTVPRLFRVLLILAAVSFLGGALFGHLAHAGTSTSAELEAVATVWKFSNELGSCSAVAVAPGIAMTALHCAPLVSTGVLSKNFQDKTYKVKGMVAHPDGKDNIAISVPGLPCPCATITEQMPKRGDETYLVGHPLGGPLVLLNGTAQELYHYSPDLKDQMEGLVPETYWAITPAAIPGMSGGGAFVLRRVVDNEGFVEWHAFLFGVTSRGGAALSLISTFGREPTAKK